MPQKSLLFFWMMNWKPFEYEKDRITYEKNYKVQSSLLHVAVTNLDQPSVIIAS